MIQLLQVEVKDILFDCGASDNFISLLLARRLGLPIVECPQSRSVSFGNGDAKMTSKVVTVEMRIQSFVDHTITFSVIDVPSTAPQIILGMPFFEKHEPKVESWQKGLVTFRNHDITITAKSKITVNMTNVSTSVKFSMKTMKFKQ